MDLLYSRYASPMELIKIYIDQGRFGEFVTEILTMHYKRKQEEAEKESDNKLWEAYIRSMSDKSFEDWKRELIAISKQKPKSYVMSDKEVEFTIAKSREILKKSKMK